MNQNITENIRKITSKDVKSIFNKREKDANKGNFGYVGVMGGCKSYSGAVKLANMAQAALRAGCGVSRLIVPESISDSVAPYLLESTLYAMPCDKKGHMLSPEKLTDEEKSQFEGAFTKIRALSVGMGWGSSESYPDILKYILNKLNLNLILDADALNTLGLGYVDLLKDTSCHVVLTPHLMEFSRISGNSIEEIKKNPVELSTEFAKKYHVILLLKGAETIVTDGNETIICDRGTPGMATAGSGDVLSGILTGLMGYLPAEVKTVAAGAFINGLAGEMAAEEFTEISMTAGDTVGKIKDAMKLILNGQ